MRTPHALRHVARRHCAGVGGRTGGYIRVVNPSDRLSNRPLAIFLANRPTLTGGIDRKT